MQIQCAKITPTFLICTSNFKSISPGAANVRALTQAGNSCAVSPVKMLIKDEDF